MNKIRFVVIALALMLSVVMVNAQDMVIPRGGTVVTSTGEQLIGQNFNPYAADPLDFSQGFVYEQLYLFNPVEGGAATPWLAVGHEYAEDLMSVTLTLREGVLWSDGEAFDADDVVFHLQYVPRTSCNRYRCCS